MYVSILWIVSLFSIIGESASRHHKTLYSWPFFPGFLETFFIYIFSFLLQGRHWDKKKERGIPLSPISFVFAVDEKEEEKNDGWDLISSRIIARGSLLLLFIISISRYRSRWVCETRPCHTNGRTVEWTKRGEEEEKSNNITTYAVV